MVVVEEERGRLGDMVEGTGSRLKKVGGKEGKEGKGEGGIGKQLKKGKGGGNSIPD